MSARKHSEIVEGLIRKGATKIDDQIDVQNIAESDLKRVAADEKFMHERVKILLHSSANPAASPYFRGGVGQDQETVVRDVPTYVFRKTLEVIARMKESQVTQSMQPDHNGEITMNSLRASTGLAYPFVVLEDKNPKGSAWLANILAERG